MLTLVVISRNHLNAPPDFYSLGDSKQVSRHHISIIWSKAEQKWICQIIGRNGVVIDGITYKRVIIADKDENDPNTIINVRLSSHKCTALKIGDVKCWFTPTIQQHQTSSSSTASPQQTTAA